MKNKVIKTCEDRFKRIRKFDNPLFYGSTTEYFLDNTFKIEKQSINTKQDFLYENDFKGNHLEFTFPIRGDFEFEINKKYMHSKADQDLFSLSAFEHKSSSIFAKKNQELSQLSINLKPNYYYKNFALTNKLTKENTNLYKISGDNTQINTLVKKLNNLDVSSELSRQESLDLVYELLENCVSKLRKNSAYYKCISRSDLAVIRNIRKYIDTKFTEKLSLANISSFSYSNEFKIKKQYKEVYGETIFETIRKKRMNYAKELILSGKLSLSEISYLCGYESYPSFYKSFKKYFSHSPSEI